MGRSLQVKKERHGDPRQKGSHPKKKGKGLGRGETTHDWKVPPGGEKGGKKMKETKNQH